MRTYQRHILCTRHANTRRLNHKRDFVVCLTVDEQLHKRSGLIVDDSWVGNAIDDGAIQPRASDGAIDRLHCFHIRFELELLYASRIGEAISYLRARRPGWEPQEKEDRG